MSKDKITLLLDSGAFSAWKRNSTVDLKAYTKFIKEHEKRLFASVALDVIPGSPDAPKSDPEGAAKASDYNVQYMLDQGVKPMPVYHQFEHPKWLIKMLNDGHDYIGISPSDRQPTGLRMEWLNSVYSLLCDKKGQPYVKTHGFGVTSTDILLTYPFYTADSTTWLILSGHGRSQTYAYTANLASDMKTVRDYSKQVMLTVSPKSSKAKSPRQLVSLHDQMDVVDEHLEKLNLAYDDIKGSYEPRAYMGIDTFEDLVAHLRDKPVRFKHFMSFLPRAKPDEPTVQLKALRPFAMRLFYVAWANKAHDILRTAGMTNRLLSYFHIKDWTEEQFDLFMQTGLIGGQYVPKRVAANGSRSVSRSSEESDPSPGQGRSIAPASSRVVRRRVRERV